MKIESSPLEDHQIKLVVEIDEKTMEAAKRKSARKIANRIKIPGFRPGKAPYSVILRQVGEAAIVEDAVELLIEDQYPKIISEASIDPYGPGNLENIDSLDPPIFEFTIPLQPEIDIGDSLMIRHPYEPTNITDSDVDEVLNNLRERQAKTESVDRPALVGDLVLINLNAIAEEDRSEPPVEIFPERSLSIVVTSDEIIAEQNEHESSEQDNEWPFPGFSGYLKGMSKDDYKTIKHTFLDSDPEPFSDKKVIFEVTIKEVQSRALPDIDDEFAEKFGGYPDLKSMRADIFNNLQEQNTRAYQEAYDNDILDKAIKKSQFKYPPQALEHEIDVVLNNLKANLERQNLDIELYKKTRELDDDGLREEAQPIAEERLKRNLFLYKIAEIQKIEVDESEVQTEAKLTLDYLSQSLTYKEAKKLSNDNLITNVLLNIRADKTTQLAMDYFRDVCSGKFDEISTDQNADYTAGEIPSDQILSEENSEESLSEKAAEIIETDDNV